MQFQLFHCDETTALRRSETVASLYIVCAVHGSAGTVSHQLVADELQ